jgi:hypothetical protein
MEKQRETPALNVQSPMRTIGEPYASQFPQLLRDINRLLEALCYRGVIEKLRLLMSRIMGGQLKSSLLNEQSRKGTSKQL